MDIVFIRFIHFIQLFMVNMFIIIYFLLNLKYNHKQ